MMIGLSFLRLKSEVIVKADLRGEDSQAITVRRQQPRMKKFVKLGHIIPVNGQRQILPNAPRPQYRRDPNDPSKALPTPIPSVAGYRPSKRRQAANYDPQTRMVTPPADPRQDTWLVYELARKRPALPPRRSVPAEQSAAKAPASNYQTGGQASSPSQRKESVQETKLFGFGRKKNKQKSSPAEQSAAEKKTGLASSLQQQSEKQQTEGGNSPLASIRAAGAAGNLPPRHHIKEEKNKKKAKENKANKKAEKEKQPKKTPSPSKPSGKKKPHAPRPNKQIARPQAVLNKETKVPPKPILAEVHIVDLDENKHLLTKLSTEGRPGEKIRFANLPQVLQIHNYDGYEFVKARNETQKEDLPAKNKDQLDFGQFGQKDVTFAIFLRHKLTKVDAHSPMHHIKPTDVVLPVTLTVHYAGAGAQTPADNVQQATWSRTRTYDQVTHRLVPKGKFDTDWQISPQLYKPVPTPKIKGFTPDLNEVVATPVQRLDLRINITYKPKQAAIKVDAAHPNEKVPASAYQKITTFTVTFTGAGARTPAAKTEKINWQRSVTADADGNLIKNGRFDTKWQSKEKSYHDVKVPVVDGFHTKQRVIVGPKVQPKNISAEVIYTENGRLIPVDMLGKVLGGAQLIKTDPADPTKVLAQQKLPVVKGYQPGLKTFTPPDIASDLHIQYRKLPAKTTKPAAAKPAVTKPVATKPAAAKPAAPKPAPPQAAPAKTPTKPALPPRVKQQKTQAAKKTAPQKTQPQNIAILTATEIVHFVDQGGKPVHADEKRTLTFHRQGQKWQRPVDRFPLVTAPVVKGYYADQEAVAGPAFMPAVGQANQKEITVTYRPFAQIIPIDSDGNVITNPETGSSYKHSFVNDPHNAARALPAQDVGTIPGWEASVKTVTPADPNVNIPVMYQKTEGKGKD